MPWVLAMLAVLVTGLGPSRAKGQGPLVPVQAAENQPVEGHHLDGQQLEESPFVGEPASELRSGVQVAHILWDWPSRVDHGGELTWASTLAESLSWWLGLSIDGPEMPLQPRGSLAVMVDSVSLPDELGEPVKPVVWSVNYGAEVQGHERADLHRAALGLEDSGRSVLMECYVDLNAIRRSDPERSGWGEVAKLLKTWRLSNARDIMIHASASPRPFPLPMVVWLDVTWSSRSDAHDMVRGKTLTHPLGMVEAAEISPDGVSWVLALDADVRTALARALGSAIASRHEDPEFEQEALRWAMRSRDRITRMQAVLDEQALVVGGDSGVGVRIPLRRQSAGRSVVSDISALQSRLGAVAQSDEQAQAGGVMLSPRTQLRWWVGEASRAGGLSWLSVDLHGSQMNETPQP